MKNFVQPGETVTVAAPAAGIASGAGYMVGNLFGVANGTVTAAEAAAGAEVELDTEGVFDLAKDDAAYAVGDAVYWDDQNSKASDASFSAALTRIGVATVAALTGDTTVRVRLDGFVTRQAQL